MSKTTPGPQRATGTLSFSGHETFTLRHGWLTKAVDAIETNDGAFNSDDALVELGVGKNMVRSIRTGLWRLVYLPKRQVLGEQVYTQPN